MVGSSVSASAAAESATHLYLLKFGIIELCLRNSIGVEGVLIVAQGHIEVVACFLVRDFEDGAAAGRNLLVMILLLLLLLLFPLKRLGVVRHVLGVDDGTATISG